MTECVNSDHNDTTFGKYPTPSGMIAGAVVGSIAGGVVVTLLGILLVWRIKNGMIFFFFGYYTAYYVSLVSNLQTQENMSQ